MSLAGKSNWVYEDLLYFYEEIFEGTHFFSSEKKKKTKTKKFLYVFTSDSNWGVQNKDNNFYILWHNPVYQPQRKWHVQAKSQSLEWLLWIAYTHDFYKRNQLPYLKNKGNEDYTRFMDDFKKYLNYKGLVY